MAVRSTVLRSKGTQAVQIPKVLAFPPEVKDVEISREGGSLVVRPVAMSWEEFFAGMPKLPDDFPDEIPDGPPPETEPFL